MRSAEMANTKTVDWLYESAHAACINEPTLTSMTKQTIKRWISDLSARQLEDVERFAANIPLDTAMADDAFRSAVKTVARLYGCTTESAEIGESMAKLSIRDTAEEQLVPVATKSASDKSTLESTVPPKKPQGGALFSQKVVQKWLTSSAPTKPALTAKAGVKDKTEATAAISMKAIAKPALPVTTELDQRFKGLYGPLKQFKARIEPISYFRDVNVQEPAVQALIRKLNGIKPNHSPLLTLSLFLQAFFDQGVDIASFVLENLRWTLPSIATQSPRPQIGIKLKSTRTGDGKHMAACQRPWYSCEIATVSIVVCAAPALTFDIFAKQHADLLSEEPLEDQTLRHTLIPSASLTRAFDRAKAAATGPRKSTSLIYVALMDSCLYQLSSSQKEHNMDLKRFMPFTHYFVLGVGPEGMMMWQSFRSYGPRLHEHIALGGAKVRDWEEATSFVATFDDFAAYRGIEVRSLSHPQHLKSTNE